MKIENSSYAIVGSIVKSLVNEDVVIQAGEKYKILSKNKPSYLSSKTFPPGILLSSYWKLCTCIKIFFTNFFMRITYDGRTI
jgi:hypothetical protein